MDFNFKPSQKLLVCLTNGDIFEGVFQRGSPVRLELSDVCEHPSGSKISCLLVFYRYEIESVKLLDSESFFENGDDGSEKSKSGSCDGGKNVILLPEAEYERLKGLSRNHVYMATMDNRFFEATDYLLSCETVGVFGVGGELGRQKSISMLVVSSWDQVYLFDILSYKSSKFHPKLKTLLESESVKKVVHDSRTLVDCLYHCHKTKLVNVFDTQVADLMLSKRDGAPLKKARNLSECLQHYLNFPTSLLDKPLKIAAEKWTARPIKDSRKIYAAQLGTYLITLKNLLERKLLQDFYTAVDTCANYLKDMSLCDAANNVSCTIPPDIKGLL